ncbi:hypothetical protein GCM10007338_08000 [Corynebacterium pelargi]|nr:hypothetical protein GCM10007338_08000 [Corynebacterium pelargi]
MLLALLLLRAGIGLLFGVLLSGVIGVIAALSATAVGPTAPPAPTAPALTLRLLFTPLLITHGASVSVREATQRNGAQEGYTRG